MISSAEVGKGPLLRLTVIESQSYAPETVFEVNACGCPLSKRKVCDGHVYIGTKDGENETQEWTNDIVFSKGEIGMGDRHCVVKYVVDTKSYYIKDTGEGTGTFIKIEDSIALQNEYIISFGSSHVFIMLTSENELRLKFLDGPLAEQLQ